MCNQSLVSNRLVGQLQARAVSAGRGHSDIARELLGACVCVAGVCAKVKSLGNMTALRVAGCFVVEIIREED